MASINKLSLRGIRSFSPEEHEQCVEFYFPITIIVGQNGCGKTTIIEALKYAITGAFPPGCGRSGNAFVHDAKCIGQTTVKANVKLRFTSRSGQTMVVVRSMELTQKKTTQTFKQLDGALKMSDPVTGEQISLSHKCTELDRQLPNMLGVSKPILEHVVFCHQEDASWPLMEGAVLKKRFDEIFDSTKYTKALVVFRQTEKDFLSKVKDLKAEVAAFGAHKQAAEAFRVELEEQNEQLNTLDDLKSDVNKELVKVDEKLTAAGDIIAQVDQVYNRIEASKNDMTREEMVVKKQRSMLEDDMTRKHALPYLQDMLRNFDQKMSGQVKHKDELRAQCDELSQSIEMARQEEISLTSHLGKLKAEEEAHVKHLRERYKAMESIAQNFSVDLMQLSQTQVNTSLVASLSQTFDHGNDDDDTSTLVTITDDDMRGFFHALQTKEDDLKAKLKERHDRFLVDDDAIAAALTEIGGKLHAVESDKLRFAAERKDAEREILQLKEGGGQRIRKGDVDDTRRTAARLAAERDELNNSPRRDQIHAEIRKIEEQIEQLKRKIEDENSLLTSLKSNADAQNSILTLQQQCDREIDMIDESIRDELLELDRANIVSPSVLPNADDEDGTMLVKAVEAMLSQAKENYDAANGSLDSAKEEVVATQKSVSEKSAMLAGNQKNLSTVKAKLVTLSSSVADMQKTVQDLKQYEAERGVVLRATEDTPRELLQYLDEQIQEIDDDSPGLNSASVAKKVIKRLRKMAKTTSQGEEVLKCPCCRREMDIPEVEVFQNAMLELEISPKLVEVDREALERKDMYQTIRKAVESKADDLRDVRRLTGEAGELEKEVKRLQDELYVCTAALKNQSNATEEAQIETSKLRAMCDTLRRWTDDANRVAERKRQIQQKKVDLRMISSDSTRDLATVDRELANLREDKENQSNKILRLNKEMFELNQKISDVSNQASNMEKLARDKEEKFAAELKALDRRKELTARITQISEEERKLSELIAPLQAKMKRKETEKHKVRSHANEEEKDLQATLNQFDTSVKSLHTVTKMIDAYLSSDKPNETELISQKVSKLVDRIAASKAKLVELEPTLASVKRAVEDQERHKKLLKQNIDVLEAEERMKRKESQIEALERELQGIEGHSTAREEYDDAKSLKDELQQKKANYDGRFSSLVEQIHALKRKLQSADYKNVDEEFRVAVIKSTTTKVAAEDLKKYGNALDKALLQFHGVKIREINKIIKELWMMTYKGQDITDIEIQSGQEPGSKAAKSYNYRVVFRKGGAQMDMRGRCSAGQRVLTSIVIRLALAETFGVNCGVVALDEPTVNLDYDNKKGLAVALAHIVASRSSQRNFQLIMITHDEEFVAMMKTELTSMTGFSMPEKYFQVCREESADGKFYSKIHAIDWDELV